MKGARICFLGLALLATGGVRSFVTSEGEATAASLLRDKAHHEGMGGNTALLTGTLTLVEGCFLIKDQGEAGVSPVWPIEFSHQETVDGIEIVDGSGRTVARVGEKISVCGSSYSDWDYERAPTAITGNLNCPKPFWGVVGISPMP